MYHFLRVCGHFSHVQLFVTPCTVAFQASLFVGFSRQGYCSALPCSPLGDLPNAGIKPMPLMSPALAGRLFNTGAPWEAYVPLQCLLNKAHFLFFSST